MSIFTPVAPARLGQPVTLRARKGSVQRAASVPHFGQIPSASEMPVIDGLARVGTSVAVSTAGLTGPFSYEWFSGGVTTGITTAQFTPAMMSVPIFCRVTHSAGITDTPALWVYMTHTHAGHNTADDQLRALTPHTQATHIALADGNWTDPAIWSTGAVPGSGAVVLIPHGQTVTYDSAATVRLDRVRVGGTLTWALDRDTYMLVETLTHDVAGAIIIGSDINTRLPAQYTAEIVISDRAYDLDAANPTDLDFANDPALVSRGIIGTGTFRTFGALITPWRHCADNQWPMAGETSVTLREAPVAWAVGDEIVISGKKITMDQSNGKRGQVTTEDETRTISAIDGAVISFTTPLVHDHDDDNDFSTQPWTTPAVINKTRNIIIRSENADPLGLPWRNGHTMVMHGAGIMDLWGAAFINMGRTDKSRENGHINADGMFQYPDRDNSQGNASGHGYEPVTAQSNVQSRYPVHAHFLGFGRGAQKARVLDCYVENTPGWGYVHHGCEADFFNNVCHLFQGSGMVSESGNELGAWADNCIFGTTTPIGDDSSVKFFEGTKSGQGDFARSGSCYHFRGRAMRVVRNFAGSAPQGYVFNHRSNTILSTDPAQLGVTVNPPKDIDRRYVDFAALSLFNWNGGEISQGDYPIRHFVGNECMGIRRGFSVTKGGPAQNADIGVNLRDNRFWATSAPFFLEYVSTYNLVDNYAGIAKQNLTGFEDVGFHTGGATMQITHTRPVVEGSVANAGNHFAFNAGSKFALPTDFYLPDHPMFSILGPTPDAANLQAAWSAIGGPTDAELEAATRIDDAVPALITPTMTGPLVAYQWNGETNQTCITNRQTYLRHDSLGAQPFPKEWDPAGLYSGQISSNVSGQVDNTYLTGGALRNYAARFGWSTWDDNGTMRDVILLPLPHSDRLDGYTIIHMYVVVCEGATWDGLKSGYPNNGIFTQTVTQPTRADITATCAKNGSVTIDILDGSEFHDPGTTLDFWRLNVPAEGIINKQIWLKPDHGEMVENGDGTVTYTPDRDYVSFAPNTTRPVSPDIAYVFLHDGRSGFATVKISITTA